MGNIAGIVTYNFKTGSVAFATKLPNGKVTISTYAGNWKYATKEQAASFIPSELKD